MDEKKSWKKYAIDAFWPPLDTPEQAKTAVNIAFVWAGFGMMILFFTGVATPFVIWAFFKGKITYGDLLSYDSLWIIYFALIFPLLCILVFKGLRKMWPAAAIGALILYLAFMLREIFREGIIGAKVSDWLTRVFILYLFIYVICGTLAYQRFEKIKADAAGLEK
jgi:hypothetical protein